MGRTRAKPLALAGAVASWIGAGLTLPYYGAEDFGLHAIAANAPATGRAARRATGSRPGRFVEGRARPY